MLSSKQIEIFYQVYKNNSMSGAAEKLQISQPSVSKTLKTIENKKFDGPKVIFGSHYIAKYVYDYFDFSFDKGDI